ncbi:MAG: Rrf2 family transcriptional regulator [Eubacteriales bacterium]|nr:Rrf2 family transcriptional regulator [Eubacteriales bacterium]
MQITSKFTIAIHILACIDYFHGKMPVNSEFLAGSIGANPVIVRGVMSKLHKAGIISASRGKNDISLEKDLDSVTLLDIYKLTDRSAEDGLFHFHENPNPECPVGSHIHVALDDGLIQVQQAMEDEMSRIPISSVTDKIKKELGE